MPEQLEPEHSQLLGRGAKQTDFEVGSKSFNVNHAFNNQSEHSDQGFMDQGRLQYRTNESHALLTPMCCGPAMCCGIGG